MTSRRGRPRPEPPRSFTDFYRQSYRGMLLFTCHYAGPGIDAENIVAEAFARACAWWPRLDDPQPWVYRVVINLVHEARSDGQLTGPSADPCPDDQRWPGWASAARLPGAEWGAEISAIQQGLRQLPNQQRAAVILEYQGWSRPEIAAALGCRASTVRGHLHHGRLKLREILGEQQPARQPAPPNTGVEGRTA